MYKKIARGMSKDNKYHLVNSKGNFMIRVRGNSHIKMKRKVLDLNKTLFEKGVNVGKPVKIIQSTQCNYSIFEWVEGIDLEFVINTLPIKKQYNLGRDAAMILKSINNIKIDEKTNPFTSTFILNSLEHFEKNFYKEHNSASILVEFVLNNLKLIDFNDNSYVHTDFHIGNFIFRDGEIFLVDFENYEIGEVYRDLTMLQTYNRNINTMFSTGILDAIQDNGIDFWIKYKLYNTLYLIMKCNILNKKSNKQEAIKNINIFLKDYGDMEYELPEWFTNDKKLLEE